ncbi:glucosamine-6-phosphate deaminase [Actinopolymorpha cephalotaxi]|uniref:Glucosamine-6-phosphate deaminase n=1 Tax=Actinopolymorpha cephalotaxi TaxID=504797 RepID=A0A1I2UJ63_9ACTN|nr:6-phosphogluconolactonase [Actinopolymorpha cephalotaxi]NYH86614.1 glucosamine-6-phosphate deaminase [Actinopolymorpha cephalotaxi]SFG77083.1 glucosamine-6-phosphate deaminase [Actinopolymorpha cephalotaxi]
MRIRPTLFTDADALGRALAAEIADGIEAANSRGRRYLLGCPGGRSAMTTYAALADQVRIRRVDLSGLVIVMMDEYVEAGPTSGTFGCVADHLAHSCRGFGRDLIAAPLSAAAGPERGVREDHLWVPDPADPAAYDRQLTAAGGIDLFILASGASDGHVAFNPPGTPTDAETRIVPLAPSTRQDNLVTFPHLRTLDRVPTHGVGVGVATIRTQSRRAVMVVHGADKARAAAQVAAADGYDPAWPATIVSECARPGLYVDQAAAVGLGRGDPTHPLISRGE